LITNESRARQVLGALTTG